MRRQRRTPRIGDRAEHPTLGDVILVSYRSDTQYSVLVGAIMRRRLGECALRFSSAPWHKLPPLPRAARKLFAKPLQP